MNKTLPYNSSRWQIYTIYSHNIGQSFFAANVRYEFQSAAMSFFKHYCIYSSISREINKCLQINVLAYRIQNIDLHFVCWYSSVTHIKMRYQSFLDYYNY